MNTSRVLFFAVLVLFVILLALPALAARPQFIPEFAAFLICLFAGMLLSRYYGILDHAFVFRISGVSEDVQKRIFDIGGIKCFGDYFIWTIYSVLGLYIVAYIHVVAQLPQPKPDSAGGEWVQFIPAFATGLAIFSLAFVTARYAGFLRLISILDVLCDRLCSVRHNARPSGLESLGWTHVDEIQKAVFRMETLYEPPGNMFVTIGIMGTFLGLAFGLSTLPLSQMMATHDIAVGVGLAVPFVRSMGLALGISTTGVIAALAAHLWRSWGGPPAAVDELISRARAYVEERRESDAAQA